MAATTPPKKKKLSVGEIAAKAKPMQRTVPICVAGDLSAEHERLTEELEEAVRTSTVHDPRLAGNDQDERQLEIARRIQELEAEMAESTYDFTFRALAPKAWSDLLAKHPDPKKERLFNQDTFVPAAIAACCIDPEGMDDPEQVAALFDALSAGQQGDLFQAAWEVNQAGPFVGKTSSLASAVLRLSETSSATA